MTPVYVRSIDDYPAATGYVVIEFEDDAQEYVGGVSIRRTTLADLPSLNVGQRVQVKSLGTPPSRVAWGDVTIEWTEDAPRWEVVR